MDTEAIIIVAILGLGGLGCTLLSLVTFLARCYKHRISVGTFLDFILVIINVAATAWFFVTFAIPSGFALFAVVLLNGNLATYYQRRARLFEESMKQVYVDDPDKQAS